MSDTTLEQRITVLERQVQSLFAALDPSNSPPTRSASIDPDTGEVMEPAPGIVPRGKYTGRKHADVVKADPHHVVWLADNIKAYGLGYGDADIQVARKLAETTPQQKRGSYR